ncbi:MAG: helicase [Candidatus Roizmanbacteria bacterium]
MKKFPVVLDIESKFTFRDFSDHKKLGVSVAVIYDYKLDKATAFLENELNLLFPILENASYIIGYNIVGFDIPVLGAYYAGNVESLSTFDLLESIREQIGRRIGLNDVISATLGKKKTGHGLMAIDMYREGRIEELKDYCLHDVLYTKELFDYGVRHGEVFFEDQSGKKSIKINWKKYLEHGGKDEMPLTLPF